MAGKSAPAANGAESAVAARQAQSPAAAGQPDRPGLLCVAGVSYTYPGTHTHALDDASLTVHEGEFVSVVGPSGCGKSTLVQAAAGLITGYDGAITFKNEPIERPHPKIGVVFQEDSTFPWRTARRNVEFGLEMQGMPKKARRDRAMDMLGLVGLAKFADHYPSQLSGGMKQRVTIARTLITEPALLLMDEPFGALDEQTRMLLGEELLRIQQDLRQTVLFITHSISEAIMLSDRVALMSRGPGRIKDVITIGFPRPRQPDLASTPEYGLQSARIWSSIREESLRQE